MFDMSPLISHEQDYIQVGIAPRDKGLDVGQVRYEPKFSGYNKGIKSLDMS